MAVPVVVIESDQLIEFTNGLVEGFSQGGAVVAPDIGGRAEDLVVHGWPWAIQTA
jgi:hypothetical protein